MILLPGSYRLRSKNFTQLFRLHSDTLNTLNSLKIGNIVRKFLMISYRKCIVLPCEKQRQEEEHDAIADRPPAALPPSRTPHRHSSRDSQGYLLPRTERPPSSDAYAYPYQDMIERFVAFLRLQLSSRHHNPTGDTGRQTRPPRTRPSSVPSPPRPNSSDQPLSSSRNPDRQFRDVSHLFRANNIPPCNSSEPPARSSNTSKSAGTTRIYEEIDEHNMMNGPVT